MKKITIALVSLVLLSFTTNQEKSYTLKITQSELNTMWQSVELAQQAILKSDLPVKEATVILGRLDSVKALVAKQVNAQLKDEKKP